MNTTLLKIPYHTVSGLNIGLSNNVNSIIPSGTARTDQTESLEIETTIRCEPLESEHRHQPPSLKYSILRVCIAA